MSFRRGRVELERACGGPAHLRDALKTLAKAGTLRYRYTKNFVILEADRTKLELAVASFDGLPAQDEAGPPERRLPPRLVDTPLPLPATIRDEWRTKLAQSGFIDVERNDGSLKGALPGSFFSIRRGIDDHFRALGWQDHSARATYFQQANRWLHAHAARNLTRRDRAIWREHACGRSSSEIAAALDLNRRSVSRIIAKLRKLSGIVRSPQMGVK
jgi:DNA-binding CsgD family transcriptional regulator